MNYETVREAARLITDMDYHCPDCLLWAAINADARPFDIKLCWNECNIDRTMIPKLQGGLIDLTQWEQPLQQTVIENDVNIQFRKELDEVKSRYNFLLNKITELQNKKRKGAKYE